MAAYVKTMHNTAMGLIQARLDSTEAPKVIKCYQWLLYTLQYGIMQSQVKDLLQLMIETTDDESSDGTRLTSEIMAGFSVDFLLAGYETTANTLSYTTYLLAMNPDVQEKLQAEIDQYFEEDPVSGTCTISILNTPLLCI